MTAVVYEGITFGGYNTASFSHTLSTGNDRWIVVFVGRQGISGTSHATGVTFDGNAMTQLGSNVSSVDTEIDCAANVWIYQVPEGESGSKTIAVSGGTGRPVVHAFEVSRCRGAGQIDSVDDTDTNIVLSGVKAGSLCIDQCNTDNAITPTVDEGNTSRDSGNHNDGDDRYDAGWGASSEAAPAGGGSVTMGWNAGSSTRTYFAVEMLFKGARNQIITAL
jgi:hypothetical protein